jgi:hypothetical protein
MIFYSVVGKENVGYILFEPMFIISMFCLFKRDAQYYFDKNKSLYFWVDIDYHSLKISTFVVAA